MRDFPRQHRKAPDKQTSQTCFHQSQRWTTEQKCLQHQALQRIPFHTHPFLFRKHRFLPPYLFRLPLHLHAIRSCHEEQAWSAFCCLQAFMIFRKHTKENLDTFTLKIKAAAFHTSGRDTFFKEMPLKCEL